MIMHYLQTKMVLIGLSLIGGTLGVDGQKQQTAPPASSKDIDVRVYQLKHTLADSIPNLLVGLTNVSISVDNSSNSVIVRGTPDSLKIVERLITRVDEQNQAADATETVFIPVRYRDVADVLGLVANGSSLAYQRIRSDPINQMLIVTASPSYIASVRDIIKHVDTPTSSLNLLFFFIRGDVGVIEPDEVQTSLEGLPEVLRPVGAELRKNGFSSLSLLTTMTTQALENNEFHTSGSLDNTREGELHFQVEGKVRQTTESGTARIQIEAEVIEPLSSKKGRRSVFSIATTLVVKFGDYVVLATAPGAGEDALALVVRVDKG